MTSTTSSPIVNRISTYLKGNESPIEFHKCLIQLLGSKTNSININVQLSNSRLFVSASEENGVILKHPPFCPMLDPSPHLNLDRNTIDVGVCGLLESKDDYMLLTRRSKNLRTFPGCWVPPGGAVDPEDDSLLTTCMRELAEETGLKDLNLQGSKLLCCWESVFPYMSSMGPPKRHHLVVYYLLKSNKTREEMNTQFLLQKEEVDAVAWIHSSLAHEVTSSITDGIIISDSNAFMEMYFLEGEKLEIKKVPTSQFFSSSSNSSVMQGSERITTGTMFAIAQWAMTKFPSTASK